MNAKKNGDDSIKKRLPLSQAGNSCVCVAPVISLRRRGHHHDPSSPLLSV